MKKYLILSAIALIGLTAVASAQSFTFSNNLTVGSSGDDVANLQTWLISKGYDIPAISSGISGKGFFGSQTKAALIRYQTDIDFPAFGFFGPMTRDRINHGGDNNDNRGASLRVASPNGGETWVKGTTQYITWTGAQGVLNNQTADIKLEFPVPACAQPGQPIRCMIMVRAPYIIASGVNLNSGSYAWNVGSVTDLSGAGLIVTTDGQYKVQICPTNGSQCTESASDFTITTNGVINGQAPVVSGVDAPTTLAINQTGTWTVHATDPLNGTLSYSVDWGDTASNASYGYAAVTPQYTQSTSFTHAYTNAGTYTVRFTVRNSSGLTVQTTSTVTVTGSTAAGPLRIISPNGGEVWTKGTTQNIVWTSPYYFAAAYADLKLIPAAPACPQYGACPQFLMTPYIIATNIPINQNSYSWSVGNGIQGCTMTGGVSCGALTNVVVPDGQYTVQICQSGTSVCDSSDATFTVTSSSSSGSLQVISPNGGETWVMNTTQAIRWNTANILGNVDIYLVRPATTCLYGQPCAAANSYRVQTNIANSGSYSWLVGQTQNNYGGLNAGTINTGQYLIEVCPTGTSSYATSACDSSNGTFTLAASSNTAGTITVISPNGGESWTRNSIHQILWTYANADANSKVDLYLGRLVYPPCAYPLGGTPPACTPQFQTQYVLDKNVAAYATYNWIVGTDMNNNQIPAGSYQAEVCVAGTSNTVLSNACAASNSTFNII